MSSVQPLSGMAVWQLGERVWRLVEAERAKWFLLRGNGIVRGGRPVSKVEDE